jgi:hypothetical protein
MPDGERLADASPMPLTWEALGAFFLAERAQAARFSDGNTGRLAPCRYKVSGIGRKPAGFPHAGTLGRGVGLITFGENC